MTRTRTIGIAAVAALAATVAAGRAEAQVFTPTYMTPVPSNDVGIYVSDGPGELAVEGIWRRVSRGGSDLGMRVGYADVGDGALMVGLEVRNPVILAGQPIGLAFTAGGQAVVGDRTGFGGQLGFTAGHPFRGDNLTFTPYVHPRLALVRELPPRDDSTLEFGVRADLGFDLQFDGGVGLRFAANLGRGADFGVGVSFRQ